MATGQDVCGTGFNKDERKFSSNFNRHRKPYYTAFGTMAVNQVRDMCENKQHEIKPATEQEMQVQSTIFKSKIINRFVLGKDPHTQIIVGLKGLEPEILLSRQYDFFTINWEELQKVESMDTRTTLSNKPTNGGNLHCLFNPGKTGEDASFERAIEPYSCAIDSSESVIQKFELSHYEVYQLKKQLASIKTAAAALIDNQAVFELMYELIVSAMQKTYISMNTDKPIDEMYLEIVRHFKLSMPATVMVREFLSTPTFPLSPFQLHHVFDICLNQHVYLKNRLELNNLFSMDYE